MELNQRDLLIKTLNKEQDEGHLKMFNLKDYDAIWEWTASITDQDKKDIYNYMMRKKYSSLNRKLMYLKIPLIPVDDQLKLLHENGYKSFRDAKEKGVIA